MQRHALVLALAAAAGAAFLLRPDTQPERPQVAVEPAGEDQALAEAEVLAALAEHPELIPYEGVLGGRMHFVPEESRVEADRTVLAVFEDGHRRGQMRLRYEVAPDGRIRWEVLEARLD